MFHKANYWLLHIATLQHTLPLLFFCYNRINYVKQESVYFEEEHIDLALERAFKTSLMFRWCYKLHEKARESHHSYDSELCYWQRFWKLERSSKVLSKKVQFLSERKQYSNEKFCNKRGYSHWMKLLWMTSWLIFCKE